MRTCAVLFFEGREIGKKEKKSQKNPRNASRAGKRRKSICMRRDNTNFYFVVPQ